MLGLSDYAIYMIFTRICKHLRNRFVLRTVLEPVEHILELVAAFLQCLVEAPQLREDTKIGIFIEV